VLGPVRKAGERYGQDVPSSTRPTGIRRLEKVDLWEISIVTFPMLPQARVGAGLGEAALKGHARQRRRPLAPPFRAGPAVRGEREATGLANS
jgi:Caudovirus prohead serine protease